MKLNIQLFGGRGASSSNGSTTKWKSLARQFKSNLQTDGINNIQLNGREEIQKIFDIQNSGYKDYNSISLKELNNSPIAIYFKTDYGEYMNVYKNRKEMFNSIKNEYGGFKEYTAGSKYSISYVGKGEFYLTRDKFSSGGWKWTDGNGRTVEYDKQRKKYKR